MERRRLAWTLAAVLHLALVVGGAASLRLPTVGPWTALLALYREVSGADTNYAFFAPAVGSLARARMTMRDGQGASWEDALLDERTSPFAWRVSALLDIVPRSPERLRRGLTASWAGVMFARHPVATEVEVDAQLRVLPTMAEWRQGARPSWMSVYQSAFVRKGSRGDSKERP